MTSYIDADAGRLRASARQFDEYAKALRKWGTIPEDWLKAFPSGYGTIADPLHGALTDYYNRRHDKAEREAKEAEDARDQLLSFADRLEHTDHSGQSRVGRSFQPSTPEPVVGGPTRHDDMPKKPADHEDSPRRSPTATPESPDAPAPSPASGEQTGPPPADGHQDGGVGPIPPTTPNIAAPAGTLPAMPPPEPDTAPPTPLLHTTHTTDDQPIPAMLLDADTAADHRTGAPPDPSIDSSVPPTGPILPGPGPAPRPPAPIPSGPLLASAGNAERSRPALPPLVVGGDIDDDLTLARALLSAALFAVGDSAPGVEWATTVLRTEIGVVIALTSTEGRGWLPPGLFLPTEVLIPWQWDSLLSTDDRQDMATLEGDADPARILAEFGRYVCRDLPGELSAVASSATVGDDVRAMLGDRVAVAERVAAEESSVDLSRPGAGLVDRLDMAGSPAAQQRAAEVLDSEIRAICLQLTQTGDDLVRKAVPGSDPEVLAQRARRHQAMEYLRNGGNGAIGVRSVLGKERHTSDAVGASVFAPVGAPPGTSIPERARDSVTLASSGAHIERARALERRADELVSLLTTGRADRQLLREILYTFDQVSEHPQLRAMTQALDMAAASKTAAGIRPAEYTSVPESPRLHSEQRSF